MNQKEFDALLNQRLAKIKDILQSKGTGYSFNNDRLHNFKVAARITGESSPQALWGMALKHLVSMEDLIKGRLENTRGNVDEKLGDMINYLILLEALFEDIRNI